MRKTLRLSLVMLLAALGMTWGLAPAAHAAYPKLELKIGFGANRAYLVAAQLLADRLKEKTGGQITMSLFPDHQLGAERDMVEAVQIGTLDAVCTSTGPVGGFVKETLMVDFPFLFRDSAHAYKALDGPIGTGILDKFAAKNMIGVAWLENGWRHITNGVRPIRAPEDLKGLKLRTMENPIHVATFRLLGVNPTPIPATEIYNALQQKVVDGQENPYAIITMLKLYEVQKYVSETGHFYSPALLIMSKKSWDKLPADIQKMVMDLRPELSKVSREFNQKADSELAATVKAKGLEIIAPIDKGPFIKATEPIYEQFGDRVGKDLLKQIREMK